MFSHLQLFSAFQKAHLENAAKVGSLCPFLLDKVVSQGKHLAGRGLVTLRSIAPRPGCLLVSGHAVFLFVYWCEGYFFESKNSHVCASGYF